MRSEKAGEKMENKEKKKKIQWKHIIHAVVSFVIIYIIAVLFVGLRVGGSDGAAKNAGLWGFMQMFLFPVFFMLAGYFGTVRFTGRRYAASWVLLPGLVFSLALFGLWYISLEASAVCNMIAAQACYFLDHLLRGYFLLYGDEYTYLGRTDMYRYFILPFLYFLSDFIYWLCFLWGNRLACPQEKSRKKKKRKKKNG